MSLHKLAKKVQSTGRGRDSMLVHMSPREVRGLQQLAKIKGGALTTNPETGLPEAGFLEDILPMVAAGAAIYFTAGAATPMLMSAGMGATSAGILAGAGSGALIGAGSAAIQGGDVGQAALMGGATGALGGAISGMGGATAPVPGAESVNAVGQTAGTSAVAANAPVGQAAQVGTQAINVNPTTGMAIDPLAAAPTPVPGAQGGPSLSAPQFSTITPAQAGQMTSADVAGLDRLAAQQGVFAEGAYQLPTQSSAAVSPPMNEGQRIMKQQADAVAAAQKDPNASWWSKQSAMEKAGYSTLGAGLVAGLNAPPGETGAPDEDYTSPVKRISPNFRAQEPIRPNPYYRSQYPVYAAEGGLMDAYQAGGPAESMSMDMAPQGGLMAAYPMGKYGNTIPNTEVYGMGMAKGGIASLGGYSDGGRMLKGPGDGMSDSIPGIIANKQPARLADGEFVVPADVVSHIGNGSTDAGAKKLYAMMAKVRKARTGKKKQAPAVNTARFLPA
jgi:hypothetical protein